MLKLCLRHMGASVSKGLDGSIPATYYTSQGLGSTPYMLLSVAGVSEQRFLSIVCSQNATQHPHSSQNATQHPHSCMQFSVTVSSLAGAMNLPNRDGWNSAELKPQRKNP